jgi:hypothetical protein
MFRYRQLIDAKRGVCTVNVIGFVRGGLRERERERERRNSLMNNATLLYLKMLFQPQKFY